MSGKLKNSLPGRRVVPPWPTPWPARARLGHRRVVSLAAGRSHGQAGRRAGFVAAIVCFVSFAVFAPVSVPAADKTVWAKFDNSVPSASDLAAMNGRIPLGTAGKGDANHTWGASVIKDGSIYKMWYSGYDGNWRIYYATSPDGLNWSKYDNNIPGDSDSMCTNGTISIGSAGQGDSTGVSAPSVIKDVSTYKMWYRGVDDGGTNRIYYASSPDGLTWTKKNNDIPADSDTTSDEGRIPLGTSGKGDIGASGYPTVILEGSTYKMWYGGEDDASNWRIYHATSTDGLTWTKFDNSVPPDTSDTTNWGKGRIPLGTSGGDTNHVRRSSVILDGSIYRMWYAGSGGGKWRIYNATSTDGLTWTKVTNAIPGDTNTTSTLGRIPLGTSGNGDDSVVYTPTVIKDGDTYKMWYTGMDGAKYRIYLATSTDSLNWTKKDNTIPDASDLPACNGRIPLGTTDQGDDAYVQYQSVIKDGTTNRMWYSGHDGSNWRIYYATSLDGLTWVKYDNNIPDASDSICTNGTIALGKAGTGDERAVLYPSVIKDGSSYKMWYIGRDSGNTGRIYYATSSNCLTWIKYTNAVPPASNTNGTDGRVPMGTSGGDAAGLGLYCTCVIEDGAFYKMWYGATDGTNVRIYHATSSNGLTWAKYDNSVPAASDTTSTNGRIPVGTNNKGDEKNACYPTVIKVGSLYKMWYSGRDVAGPTYRIYYATSTDGLTWKKYDNSIPDDSDTTSTNGCVPLGDTGGDINGVAAPFVIKDGYTYKMWYTGQADTWRIYHATLDALPKGLIFIGH